jgi:hypothetical protein
MVPKTNPNEYNAQITEENCVITMVIPKETLIDLQQEYDSY